MSTPQDARIIFLEQEVKAERQIADGYKAALKSRLDDDERLLARLAEAGRWEIGFRSIVTILIGARTEFEIKDIVERVRSLAAANCKADEITASMKQFVDLKKELGA
jgi:hypothetical protein